MDVSMLSTMSSLATKWPCKLEISHTLAHRWIWQVEETLNHSKSGKNMDNNRPSIHSTTLQDRQAGGGFQGRHKCSGELRTSYSLRRKLALLKHESRPSGNMSLWTERCEGQIAWTRSSLFEDGRLIGDANCDGPRGYCRCGSWDFGTTLVLAANNTIAKINEFGAQWSTQRLTNETGCANLK